MSRPTCLQSISYEVPSHYWPELLLGDRPALEGGLSIALDDLDGHVEQVDVTGGGINLDLLTDG